MAQKAPAQHGEVLTSAAISKSKTLGYAWVVLVVVFLASVAAPLNQFKVPPVMPTLMKSFNLDLGTAGLLMSVFALAGFILAIPAGFILQRLGAKVTGLIAIASLVIGASLGAMSTTAGLMLTSRIVEGIGMGLIAVVAPAVIAMWFPAAKRGIPMGLWATWVPMGMLVIYNLAPVLAARAGWQAVWWFSAAFSLFTLIIYWVFARMPSASEQSVPETRGTGLTTEIEEQPSLGKAMANRNIWLLSFDFCCFNAASIAIGTFLPTFLVSMRGYSLGLAAFVTSLSTMVCLLSCPVGGLLSDRLGTRKWVYTVPFAIAAVMWLFPFTITGWLIPAYTIALGLISGPVATATFAAVPETMKRPQLVGIGMAIVMLGQNLGMFVGPAVFGKLAESVGWATAGYMLIPISILGIVAGWLVKVR